jgi:hypothetical protein
MTSFRLGLLFTFKEIGPEVTAEKIKYMFMSWDQNAGKRCRLELGNYFEVTQQQKIKMAFIKISRDEVISGGAECIEKSSSSVPHMIKSGRVNGRGVLKL